MFLLAMGLLFILFTVGLLSALILCCMPNWRWLATFALVPILGASGAFGLCSGLGLGLGYFLGTPEAGGIGFLAGYVLGGLLGVWLGGWLAWRLVRHHPALDHLLFKQAVNTTKQVIRAFLG